MANEVFNRYEYKYLMDEKTYMRVLKIMDEYMILDEHNQDHQAYTIANVYFDTNDDYLIRHSLNKPMYKEKLRLRSYGIPLGDTKVFLEIKKKFDGIVNKRRTVLTLKEAYFFIETGILPEVKDYMNKQVLKEIAYFLQCYDLQPKLYIAYDRVAYFEDGNPDLRISFDHNIRSRRHNVALESGDYGKQLLDDKTYLMEIKTSKAIPLWLSHMLSELHLQRCSFSKYGAEFKNNVHSKETIDTIERIAI